jgi:hypothetical protein
MRSTARGQGTDLAGARPYRVGDDARRIDWRASARLSSARGTDEFVVREHLSDEATRVIVVIDRSPTMQLYPPELPWLRKPAAVGEACDMILESALQAGCAVGILDEGEAEERERGEGGRLGATAGPAGSWRIRRQRVHADGSGRPHDSIAGLFAHLVREERTLPAGTFVFLLSDFLDFPADETWQEALDRSLDVVPVVIQDPVWEQSFPDVAGAVLPLADPASGRVSHVRLSRADVRGRRDENRARLRDLQGRFDAFGLDYALVSSHDRGSVLEAFVDWAGIRHQGARLA